MIQIRVLDTRTDKEEKPTKYNTFWDEHGNLLGIQDFFKIIYRIEMGGKEE